MTEEPEIDREVARPAETTSRSEALIIIALATLSFAAGFLIVNAVLPQKETAKAPAPCAAPEETTRPDAPPTELENSDTPAARDTDEDLTAADDGAAPAELAPGPTPDGIRIDGAPLYFRCWSEDGTESRDCDRLTVLEKRMQTRLYAVHECKTASAKEDLGLLSLGANLDFTANTISFWSGPSTTLPAANRIGDCLRANLSTMPISGIDHKFSKYRIFFSVEFFDPDERAKLIARKRSNGKEVKVVKDRVNVRETPVDGPSIGRISSDSTVVLLKRNETKDWCMVITPSNKEGWMICEALGL